MATDLFHAVKAKLYSSYMQSFLSPGPPSLPDLSCAELSENAYGTVSVTVCWTLSGGDNADFYLINIATNDPQPPYGGLLKISDANVTQCELTGFRTGYEYNITVRGVNCGSQKGSESEPLTITPEGTLQTKYGAFVCYKFQFRITDFWQQK